MKDEHRQFLRELVAGDGLDALVKQKEREIALGLTLYDLRSSAGLTQQALAKAASVQQSQISRWESDGIPASTQLDTIVRVFGALGADLSLHIATRPSGKPRVTNEGLPAGKQRHRK